MNILLADPLPPEQALILVSDNVSYRPDLHQKSDRALLSALERSGADALVSRRKPALSTLEAWISGRSEPAYWIEVDVGPDDGEAPARPIGLPSLLQVLRAEGDTEAAAYRSAFAKLERVSSERRLRTASRSTRIVSSDRHRVLLVGAGLVNLVTAALLSREGYDVRLVDAGPDPRAGAHWTHYGASRGGEDARMFTLSEMDNYNDRTISPTMNDVFRRTVENRGWGIRGTSGLSPSEQSWIHEHERLPVWLAERYNQEIFQFNSRAGEIWTDWIGQDRELFEASLLRPGILRIYSDVAHCAASRTRQDAIGATLRALSSSEVAEEHPALAEAVAAGRIAGGVFVRGFTLNAHKFMHGVLDRLERCGVTFLWRTAAERIAFGRHGNVEALETADGPLHAEHMVISPGAYGDALLRGTRTEGRIHGVLGAWLRLPNVDPELRFSLKLARKGHITEDANVTIGMDGADPIMMIGSGYGHTGVDPADLDEALLRRVYDGLVDTARQYFPAAHAKAVSDGTLQGSLKHCVRPWTATGLGVFELIPTSSGGRCVITGGHNTGGFAQSPAVAEAVLAALQGREHAMHAAYQPDRASVFLGSEHPARGGERGPHGSVDERVSEAARPR